jgi:DNA primase large subunit
VQRLHARYPFLTAAREAVEAADVDLVALVQEGGPAVERGVERVRRALLEGSAESEERLGARAELLSYPVARVLVSLIDAPGATEKYARAEAALAQRRFTADFQEERSLQSGGETLSLQQLLADFDLAGDVRPTGDGRFDVAVTAYLRLSSGLDGDNWRLVRRTLSDGVVPVSNDELETLLREAVRGRVADGLPLNVPEPIADALSEEVGRLRTAVADADPPRSFAEFEVEALPPCVDALIDRARAGEDLPDNSRFALVGFLAAFEDLDAHDIAAIAGLDDPERVRYQLQRLRDDRGVAFAPPSCATMQAYGDCVNKDDLCAEIAHPLSYYSRRAGDESGGDGAGDDEAAAD